MSTETPPEDDTADETEYPVYEPADYSGQTYPLNGRITVWDPDLHRTVDASKSRVPDDSVILEIETIFVEREYRLIVKEYDTALAPDPLDAKFIALGGAYPGVTICYPIDEEEYLEIKRPFTKQSMTVQVREGPCPDPAERSSVIWVATPEDQTALMEEY